jgi:hypothetical protein
MYMIYSMTRQHPSCRACVKNRRNTSYYVREVQPSLTFPRHIPLATASVLLILPAESTRTPSSLHLYTLILTSDGATLAIWTTSMPIRHGLVKLGYLMSQNADQENCQPPTRLL